MSSQELEVTWARIIFSQAGHALSESRFPWSSKAFATSIMMTSFTDVNAWRPFCSLLLRELGTQSRPLRLPLCSLLSFFLGLANFAYDSLVISRFHSAVVTASLALAKFASSYICLYARIAACTCSKNCSRVPDAHCAMLILLFVEGNVNLKYVTFFFSWGPCQRVKTLELKEGEVRDVLYPTRLNQDWVSKTVRATYH